jgi:hypothetical protein
MVGARASSLSADGRRWAPGRSRPALAVLAHRPRGAEPATGATVERIGLQVNTVRATRAQPVVGAPTAVRQADLPAHGETALPFAAVFIALLLAAAAMKWIAAQVDATWYGHAYRAAAVKDGTAGLVTSASCAVAAPRRARRRCGPEATEEGGCSTGGRNLPHLPPWGGGQGAGDSCEVRSVQG